MANRAWYLSYLVLLIYLLEGVEGKYKDCGKHCFGSEISVVMIAVFVSLVSLAFIIGIIVSIIWCCCFRNGGELIHKISESRSGGRPYIDEYNLRSSVLNTRHGDDEENNITFSNQIQEPSIDETTQPDTEPSIDEATPPDNAPPSYEEVMRKNGGQMSLATSSV